MAVHLDHLLVPSRNRVASARLLARLLGVPWAESGVGPFSPVWLPVIGSSHRCELRKNRVVARHLLEARAPGRVAEKHAAATEQRIPRR